MKPLLWIAIAAGLLFIGRCSAPRPQGPSADSTLTMAARDTLILVDSSLKAASARVDTVIRWLRARTPPVVPPRPLPGAPVDSTVNLQPFYDRIAYDSATIDTLGRALVAVRDTLEAVRPRLDLVGRQLESAANRIGALERRKVYPWVAGVILQDGLPVGGFVSRSLWRASVQVQVLDLPDTKPALLVGVGVGF